MKYILAIDQGTTSTRAIVFDHQQNIVKVAQKEVSNIFPKPGWVEQDPDEIWLSTLSVIQEVFYDGKIKPEEIGAIGISNQRETTILWDKKTGRPLYNAIVWQSRQTSEITDRYKKMNVEAMVKDKTGLILDPYFSATKIRWMYENVEGIKDNPDVLFGTVDSWLLWKMTNGRVHTTDVTNASRTLLFNIRTLSWDQELLELFEIPEHILPEVKNTADDFGEIEEYYFFSKSCPIRSVVGDQQAALFGQSCFEKGEGKNTYGTGGFLLINSGEEAISSMHGLLSTIAWKVKEEVKYATEGSIFVSGSLMQWLRDGLHFFEDASESEKMARSVASSEGVILVPAFVGLGAPYWNEKCRGAIFGLTRGINECHIVRASLEAMAYQVKDLLKAVEEDLKETIRALKVDGGASANDFLLEFQSDISNIPVIRSQMKETTALGAARFAGLMVNFWTMDDFKEEESVVFEPKISKEEADALYASWQKAVRKCLED